MYDEAAQRAAVTGAQVAAAFGTITVEMLRATFDHWRIWETCGMWFATRDGSVAAGGPESLIRPLMSAATIEGLADQLAMQEHLRRMSAAELEAVWSAGFAAVGR